jgi:hypothetical protein
VTRNYRELEDEVEKDSEDNITSKRQCDNTQVMQKFDCGAAGEAWYLTDSPCRRSLQDLDLDYDLCQLLSRG